MFRHPPATILIILLLLSGLPVQAQLRQVGKLTREIVEAITKKSAKEGVEDLARLGGEKAVKELLEKAAREGGEEVAEKLAGQAVKYGPEVLMGAKVAPAKFVRAFDNLAKELKTPALQAIRREMDRLPAMVAEFGDDALLVAARHPGVGTTVLQKLGTDAAPALRSMATDDAIRLARFGDGIAKVPAGQKRELLDLIAKAPGKVLDALERAPKTLVTASFLTGFLASKDQLLGKSEIILGPDGKPVLGPDGKPMVVNKPGLPERILAPFTRPITAILYIVGLGVLALLLARSWKHIRR